MLPGDAGPSVPPWPPRAHREDQISPTLAPIHGCGPSNAAAPSPPSDPPLTVRAQATLSTSARPRPPRSPPCRTYCAPTEAPGRDRHSSRPPFSPPPSHRHGPQRRRYGSSCGRRCQSLSRCVPPCHSQLPVDRWVTQARHLPQEPATRRHEGGKPGAWVTTTGALQREAIGQSPRDPNGHYGTKPTSRRHQRIKPRADTRGEANTIASVATHTGQTPASTATRHYTFESSGHMRRWTPPAPGRWLEKFPATDDPDQFERPMSWPSRHPSCIPC